MNSPNADLMSFASISKIKNFKNYIEVVSSSKGTFYPASDIKTLNGH